MQYERPQTKNTQEPTNCRDVPRNVRQKAHASRRCTGTTIRKSLLFNYRLHLCHCLLQSRRQGILRTIAKQVKTKRIDILLVVNMFLTGFDSKTLNTLYVDKNLKYHGLIQAFSRTNRILNELKSQGNIVCFRNLKEATDEAISLFSNLNAKNEIIMQPYEEYVALFNHAFVVLLQKAPTVNSVNDLLDEDQELEFIRAFRELIRLKNVLNTFTEFTHDDLSMSEQLLRIIKVNILTCMINREEIDKKKKCLF